jgi:peptide/nickel transport system permease protein
MPTYIARRVLLILPTVMMVTVIVFFSVRFIPGDTIDAMAAENIKSGGGGAVKLDRAKIEEMLGLDVPVYVQYGRWLGVVPDKEGRFNGLLQGNLGRSMWKNTLVVRDVAERWPVTLELGIMGLLVSQLIALPIGIFSALRQDSWGDHIARSFAIFCIAVPNFWIATLVMIFPSIWWGYLPPIRYFTITQNFSENMRMFIVPSIVLGMTMSGITMRMTRTMMLEVLRQDYIRTAWSKGLREKVVVVRHAVKNALIPVITIVGLQMPVLFAGTVIIEQIFVLPGMGNMLVDSLLKRDYAIMSGTLFLFSIVMVSINLLVDLTYAFLDPRIRHR